LLHNKYFELCALVEQINSTPKKTFVIEMDPDLVLNRIDLKFLGKMIETGSS
jgi:hypothetical protein